MRTVSKLLSHMAPSPLLLQVQCSMLNAVPSLECDGGARASRPCAPSLEIEGLVMAIRHRPTSAPCWRHAARGRRAAAVTAAALARSQPGGLELRLAGIRLACSSSRQHRRHRAQRHARRRGGREGRGREQRRARPSSQHRRPCTAGSRLRRRPIKGWSRVRRRLRKRLRARARGRHGPRAVRLRVVRRRTASARLLRVMRRMAGCTERWPGCGRR